MTDSIQPAKRICNLSTAQAALDKAERTEIVRNKVFNTTELLESILLHLTDDFKTLLLSQRVSTVFRNTIEHSTSLQKALFSISDLSTYPSIPKILHRKIKFSHDGATLRLSHPIQECGGSMRVAGIDVALEYKDMSPDMRHRSDEYFRKRPVHLNFDTKRIPEGQQRVVEVGGSWQKIPLSIPEHWILGSVITCSLGIHPCYLIFDVKVLEGDTLGSIVEEALQREKRSFDRREA